MLSSTMGVLAAGSTGGGNGFAFKNACLNENVVSSQVVEKDYYFIVDFLCFQAESAQTQACEKFESMSARGKEELVSFRLRRVAAFKKR